MLLAFVNDMAVRAEGVCSLLSVRWMPQPNVALYSGYRNLAISK